MKIITGSRLLRFLGTLSALISYIKIKEQGELHGVLQRIVILDRDEIREIKSEDIVSQAGAKSKELPVAFVF